MTKTRQFGTLISNSFAPRAASALVLAAFAVACGGDPDPIVEPGACDAVTCGDNAACRGDTGTCECVAGFLDIDGDCVDRIEVDCADVAPANASSNATAVEITWDGQRWSEPEPCPWTCDAGFGEHEGACLASRAVPCVDQAPENATSRAALVGITFEDGVGWTEPEACAWSCDTGFGEIDGACFATRDLPCRDEAPRGATSQVGDVTVGWNDGTGWGIPEACAWSCDEGLGEFEGACLASRTVACVDDPPEGASSVDPGALVAIRWTGEGFEEPARCAWSCDDGLGEFEGACLATRELECIDRAPVGATSALGPVTVPWDPASGWVAPTCSWACDAGFGEHEGSCLSARAADCSDVSPERATSIVDLVVIRWDDDAGWPEPATCIWSCDDGFGEHEGACVDERMEQCTPDPDAPMGSEPVLADVTVRWLGDRFEDPALCDWRCADGFGEFEGECRDRVELTCVEDPPEFAMTIEPGALITVFYDPGFGGFPEPVCPWSCDAWFVEEDDACVPSIRVDACSLVSPDSAMGWVEDPIAMRAELSTGAEVVDGRIDGLVVWACRGEPGLGVDLILDELSCDALVLNEEAGEGEIKRFGLDAAFVDPLSADVVVAFSVDDGARFTFCDLDGIVGEDREDLVAGQLMVFAPENGGFERWDDDGDMPIAWTKTSATVVERDDEVVRSGDSSVRLTRGNTSNGDNEFSSVLAPIEGGTDYTVSFWVYDNNPNARANIIFQFFDADGASLAGASFGTVYTVDSDEWQNLTRTASAPEAARFIRLATRVYSQAGGEATGGFFYLDDITLTVAAE